MVAEQNFGGTLMTLGCPQPSTLNAMLCSLPKSTPELLSSAITMFRQVVMNVYTQQHFAVCITIKKYEKNWTLQCQCLYENCSRLSPDTNILHGTGLWLNSTGVTFTEQ